MRSAHDQIQADRQARDDQQRPLASHNCPDDADTRQHKHGPANTPSECLDVVDVAASSIEPLKPEPRWEHQEHIDVTNHTTRFSNHRWKRDHCGQQRDSEPEEQVDVATTPGVLSM